MKQNKEIFSDKEKQQHNDLVISYLALRKYIGILGISLPIILLVGSCVANGGRLESSISDYFHTPLRQFFTIILGGMSLLLFAYKGYTQLDKWMTNMAGFFGLLTAFVFTSFDNHAKLHGYTIALDHHREIIVPIQEQCVIIPNPVGILQSTLHLVFAALFFLSLAYMSGKQFVKGDPKNKNHVMGEKKVPENRIYKICAWIIVFTILALVPAAIPGKSQDFYTENKLVFFGEVICLWAFGLSWLIKGIDLEKQNS
ncbi:hypothetical protein [Fluviicola sp.]|uniref:hypothetical protein n=1 Tax=Fluviicola sp. TaxID=1917219 RepID=UPI003D2A2B53